MTGQHSRVEVARRLGELDALSKSEAPRSAQVRERWREVEIARLIAEQDRELEQEKPHRKIYRDFSRVTLDRYEWDQISRAEGPKDAELAADDQPTTLEGRVQRGRPVKPWSEMGRLYGLLFLAVVNGRPHQRPQLRRGEWAHNLAWVRRRTRAAGTRIPKRPECGNSWAHDRALWGYYFGAVEREITRGLPRCPSCRTPILVGCRLFGKAVTRRRRSCSNACKMRAARRK